MAQNTTQTTEQEHEFLVSGCRYQWAADHNGAACWRAFMVHKGLPPETTIDEFYA